jgi:hypothetical protein
MTIGTNDNNAFNIETNGTTKVTVGATGDVTLGAAAATQDLTANFTNFRINAPAANNAIVRLQINGTEHAAVGAAGAASGGINGTTTHNLFLRGTGIAFSGDAGVTLHGAMSSTGAWTLGPSGGAKTTINGHIQIARLDVATSGNIDYTLGTGGTLKFNSGSPKTLQAVNGDGTDGRILFITNTSGTLTIKDTSAAVGTANGRIITGSGADLTITGDGAVTMTYDAADNRWRVLSVVN